MAYFAMHAYDADVWIPGFKGLNQGDILHNPDISYAADVANAETPNGVLQPQAPVIDTGAAFETRVETLASFHRRWYQGSGSKEWYVCCCAGKFYYRQADSENPWIEITLPSGISAFEKSTWSFITYELNPPGSENSLDVLILSNEKDGMIMVVPPDLPTTHDDLSEFIHDDLSVKTYNDLSSPAWNIRPVETAGYKFGVIERYAERIWGGAIEDEPDLLVYSAPYDPMDWDANMEIPEDGAGEVRQPSWDGDKFYALKRFGDQLLAFKKYRIWRIVGVSPGEYTFSELYAAGTEFFDSIAVERERIFFGTRDGLMAFDGLSSSPYAWQSVEQIWNSINQNALGQMCAVLYQNKYYLAFPTGYSEVNNALLVYNFTEGTILYYPDFHVERFMPTDGALFFTSSTVPGRILKLAYDSWTEGAASGAPVKWVSPWMDFGYKRIVKGGFELYFLAEVKKEPVTLKFSIQTEKKTKSKSFTVNPVNWINTGKVQQWGKIKEALWGDSQQNTWGDYAGKVDETPRSYKPKRLHFGGSGRRFRIIIEAEEGVTDPWRLIGGIQIVVETDPD